MKHIDLTLMVSGALGAAIAAPFLFAALLFGLMVYERRQVEKNRRARAAAMARHPAGKAR